ncbi:MAG: hypothetical protein QOJ84_4344, partial [Bradyrhizobium sp.]|nr:hypothetical protein [Bradyrhizobium sp.]
MGEQLIAFLNLAGCPLQIAVSLGEHSPQLFACTPQPLIAIVDGSHEAAHLPVRRDQLPLAFLYLADGSPQIAVRPSADPPQLFVRSDQLLIAIVDLGDKAAQLLVRHNQPLIAVLRLTDGSPQIAVRPSADPPQLFVRSDQLLIAVVDLGDKAAQLLVRHNQPLIAVLRLIDGSPQ